MTNYLPKGDENLKTGKAYLKLSQLADGENKLRFVQQPIAGWIDWNDKKPVRSRPEAKPKKSFDPEKPFKAFWAAYVWDYRNRGLYVLEITQGGVLNDLRTFVKDEDWGDLTTYDIKITKKGSGIETKYTVTPLPHKPLALPIAQALKDYPVRLEALYEGGDPWNDLEGDYAPIVEVQRIVPMKGSPKDQLIEELQKDGLSMTALEGYLKKLSEIKGKTVDEIIVAALIPTVLPNFKKLYAKELNRAASDADVEA